MSTVLTPQEVSKYEADRKLDAENEPTWKMELAKMLATLILNVVIIVLFVWAALSTSGELSSRFMGLLEVVVGAIFGVTATQITKG
jgi:F0F1-type ATP synthase membrane subunit a